MYTISPERPMDNERAANGAGGIGDTFSENCP
jgi:hypothetical protein